MIAKAEESLKQAGLNADVLNVKMQNIKATFTIEGQVIQALIGQSVMGILFSCVLGLFFKKKNKKL